MKASIIIPCWNGMSFLPACLEAVQAQVPQTDEVIVVDDASADGSADYVAETFPHYRLIRNPRNLGFPGSGNAGLRVSSGDVLILLNQDAIVQPGWIGAIKQAFDLQQVGIVGCKILYPDGRTIQHAGGRLNPVTLEGFHTGFGELDNGQYDTPGEVDFVTGAALALRRTLYQRIGGLDEQFSPGYYEDVDLCLRATRAGYAVMYWPSAVVHHLESGSFRSTLQVYGQSYIVYRSRIRYLFKHSTTDEILEGFLPSMMDRLKNASQEELHGLALSCVDAMMLWPTAENSQPFQACNERIVTAFRALHDRVIRQEFLNMTQHLDSRR